MRYSIKNLSKLISLTVVFMLCAQLSAYSGMMTGEKKLRVAKTQWFDIIYPERCEETAAILYEKADNVYIEVTEQYGLEPAFRMPVVITPAVEQLNAFWTSVPYNHIAIYDTGVTGASDLSVFSETLLSVFRHELTHAVTYNMKSGFWRGVDKVFGDCVAPGMLSVTTGMAEGATVTSESAAGEGRLNDEYSMHYVKQAKIENEFPAYHDVSGASDTQPGSYPYLFNGAFHQWLQEEYGMEPYAEFWYRVVNGKNFTISGAFKKAYKIKLKDAWKLFKNDFKVPRVDRNPVYAGLVKDFFEPDSKQYSKKNDSGSQYASPTSAAGRLVWLDEFGGRVFMADEISGDKPSYRKIFSMNGISGLRLSNDGRFLVVSCINGNAPNYKACVKIYDFNNKSFYSVKQTGLKDAVVVKNGDSWYLVAQKYSVQHYSIVVYGLEMNAGNNRITGADRLLGEVTFEPEINPSSFTPLDDGNFAFLKRNRLKYSICICDSKGSLVREYPLPEGMAVRSLSYSTGAFYFSYAQKGTMPRLGKLDAESGSLYLSSQNYSGGVFAPVLWQDRIVYIGEFYSESRLLCMKDITGAAGAAGAAGYETGRTGRGLGGAGYETEIPEDVTASVYEPYIPGNVPSKAYNPLPYLVHGILIPGSNYTTDVFSSDSDNKESSIFDNFYLGTSYLTGNPWTSGTSDLYLVTAGWNTFSNTLGTALSIYKGTETGLLRSKTDLKSEFDSDGWKQGGVVSGLSSSFSLGRISTLTLDNTAKFLLNSKEYFSVSDTVMAQFSTIRKFGPGRFDDGGFGVAVGYGRLYEAPLNDLSEDPLDVSAIAGAAKICVPHVVLSFDLLPASSIYGYAYLGEDVTEKKLGRAVFDASLEVNVFSMEIQKAIPAVTAIYLNDFYTNVGYAATGTAGKASKNGFQTSKLGDYFAAVADGTGYYLDSIFVKVGLELTPNIGLFATPSYKLGFFVVGSYTINSVEDLKPQERSKLSLGFDMNF